MKIEEELKQSKPFDKSVSKVLVNLLFTNNWVTQKMKEFLANYGLTIKQYNILRILKGAKGPLSTKEIRHRMLDRSSDVSRIVDRMEAKGLLVRDECPSDKRKVNIMISKIGDVILDNSAEPFIEWQESSVGLSSDEAEQLSLLLDKMRI